MIFLGVVLTQLLYAQPADTKPVSVWLADERNGYYRNPVLHADYSDPDAIRVGSDYYMTASSFDAIPGLPILHSKDLVNWRLIGHALRRQPPFEHFEKTQHGGGVWAPSIRYHEGEFYIYYPDPDFGIYLIKAKDASGPWSEPVLIEAGKGLIDPCPLWDDDGRNYLVYAYAGSRAGIKSVIAVKSLNAAGDRTLDEGRIVYDGHQDDPTIEGPKFYKRNGYYYIFAPAGGVATGWQVVLRSRHVYGPYERRIVMDQGKSQVNGPHQGAWVDTPKGQHWFLHFQDKDAYGRVVHLQPMKWNGDWPVIGEDQDGDGKGEPVARYKKPNVGATYETAAPPESDEFESLALGLQWQWQANPQATWAFNAVGGPQTTAGTRTSVPHGSLRLYSVAWPGEAKNLWDVPNVLMQKFPAEEFRITTKIDFKPNTKIEDERAGLVIMGQRYAALGLKSTKEGVRLFYAVCEDAQKGGAESGTTINGVNSNSIYFRVTVRTGARCQFSYSVDGNKYVDAGAEFVAAPGKWIGARMGLFCTRVTPINDSGYADIDWFRVEPVP